ncbi:hypothetical protein WCLP8_1850008 [uncultured Gammaproteobacteria bacterium]
MASEKTQANSEEDTETKPTPVGGYHVIPLTILWILIIIAGYLIWPSANYNFGGAEVQGKGTQIQRQTP